MYFALMRRVTTRFLVLGLTAAGAACSQRSTPPEPAKAPEPQATPSEDSTSAARLERARTLFGTPIAQVTTDDPEVEAARVELGRMLYYEKRLSKNHDLSCNSCHDLQNYGVDVRERGGRRIATSMGHRGAFGDRNSPTTFNAFLHVAQFWDGRAKDVEEQAKGPVLNPVEMALPDQDFAVRVLRTIPGYRRAFKAAFPEAKEPISYDHFATAVGAFERKLITPAPIDDYLQGKEDALSASQLAGLDLYMDRCAACHMGEGFGGSIYQKLGLLEPYETSDQGRIKVTEDEDDAYVFKVPSLRNIVETAPYLHDGSIDSLEKMVSIMAKHQTPQGALTKKGLKQLVAFLESLTGEIPVEYIAEPELPESGEKTPPPDPT